jgi:hypothetical protein
MTRVVMIARVRVVIGIAMVIWIMTDHHRNHHGNRHRNGNHDGMRRIALNPLVPSLAGCSSCARRS